MADIPVAGISTVFRTLDGNITHVCLKVIGDNTGVTLTAPLGKILAHAVGVADAAAGLNPQITYSGSVVTYATAPVATYSHLLHLWGY